ncbi:MAG: DNA internalization-related competence protein ComEC/Rec2 [Cyclonatronaceae bacterium]
MELRSSYRFPFSRYPAVRIAVLFVCGIWLCEITPNAGPILAAGVLAVWFTLFICFSYYSALSISVRNTSILTMIYLAGIVLAGWFRMQAAHVEIPQPVGVLLEWEQEPVQVSGHLITASINSNGTLNGVVLIDSAMVRSGSFAVNAQLRYRMFNADTTITQELTPGTLITGTGRAGGFRERRNPHEFDFRQWNYRQNIFGEIVFDSVASTGVHIRGWAPLRHRSYRLIDSMFREQNRALAKAVILGYKAELDAGMRQSFSRAGLSHIMAVSGMHVGFVLMPVWLLFPWLRTSAAGKCAAMVLLISVLVLYAGITGFTASVTRASLMAILLATGSVFCKIRDSLNLVGLAAILLLLYDPRYLYDVGFQLSFTAVIIILVSLPMLQRLIPRNIRYTWKGNVLTMFGLSILIQGGLFPVLTLYFREFSLIGPLLNVLAVPLAQILFLASFISLPIAMVSQQAALTAGIPADLMITLMSVLVDVTNQSVTGWISVQRPSVFIFLTWILMFGLFSAALVPAYRWKLIILLLIVLCAERIHTFAGERGRNQLEVVFFDVGQGDAVLIKTPSGRHILYDAGVLNPFSDSGRHVILPYLLDKGVNRLDAVILSHPHSDHIGGILSLIGNIYIGVIYQSPAEYQSALYNRYTEAAHQHSVTVIPLQQGDVPLLDPHLLAIVLAPAPDMHSRDPNAHSVVLRLQYGHTVLLLTGDAEELSESNMQATFGSLLQSSVLKAGHHGSHTSSHDYFLDEVQPETVIVSCGMRNRYNHPHRDAVIRLASTGAELWYTALEGAVILRSDGTAFKRLHWK